MTETNVIEMFNWRTERANRRMTEARAHWRANPDSEDAEWYAHQTAAEYVRAARERNEADRRRRADRAQEIANQLRDKTYQDLRPPTQR
jgi:vacuolar-type H+-ATPase subunit H